MIVSSTPFGFFVNRYGFVVGAVREPPVLMCAVNTVMHDCKT